MSIQVNLPARTEAVGITGPTGPQGDKGDPGGNAMAIGLFTVATTLSIPVGTDLVQTSGHAAAGIGKARYAYDATVDATYVTANPYTAFLSANSRGFKLCEDHPTPFMFGVRGDGATPYGARLNAWLTYCSANKLHGEWPADAGSFRTDQTLLFSSNTAITLGPITIEAATGAVRVFQISNVQNCRIVAPRGAVIDGRSVTTSNVLHITGAKNVHIEGLTSQGAKVGQDSIYLGSGNGSIDGNIYCEGIRLINCVGGSAGRNSISVISCVDLYALGCEFKSAGSAPGAGCDIEANTFSDVIRRVTFEKCKFHDNGTYGAVVEFGTDATFIDCDIYNNNNTGFAVANGGAALSTGVRRSNVDIVAVTAVNAGAGKLTVSSTSSLRVGMICLVQVRGSGVRPTGISAGQQYIVYGISGSDIQLYNTTTTGAIASFSDSGSGTLTSDPETSEIYILVYQDGAASNVKLINSRVYGNCVTTGTSEVSISTCADVRMEGCDITATKAGVYGLNAVYSRKLRVRNNHVISTVEGSGAAQGLHFGLCYDVVEEGNTVRGFAGQALQWNNCPASQFGNRSVYTNSGMLASPSALVECTSGSGGKFTGATLRQDANHATTYGSNFVGWTNGTIDACDFTGVATSNITALRSTDASMIVGTNTMWDGTTQIGRTGSKTYDAPSLTTGTETSTTVTVNGAKLGDRAHAALGLTLSGLKCVASVSASNTVTVVIRNDTGGTVDLASTTLYASAQRIAA